MARAWLHGAARALIVAAAIAAGGPAWALDPLHVGKGGIGVVYFALDVGKQAGIFERMGLDVTAVQSQTDAQQERVILSGDVDIVLSSGPAMAYRLKGVPDIAVAVLSGPPNDFVLVVQPDGPIKRPDDLKGKVIGITSRGSLTDWLAHRFAFVQGWGMDGIQTATTGGTTAGYAALARGDVAALVTTPEVGYEYQANKKARIVVALGEMAKTFITHTIIATDKLIADHPDRLQRFLKGWYTTVAYMKDPAHRAESVAVLAKAMDLSESSAGKAFDYDMLAMSDDGAFDPAAVDLLRNSLPSFGTLDYVPAAKDLFTDRFVPVKIDK